MPNKPESAAARLRRLRKEAAERSRAYRRRKKEKPDACGLPPGAVETALTDAVRALLRRASDEGERAPVIETVIWMAARDLASAGHQLDVVSAAVKERVCLPWSNSDPEARQPVARAPTPRT
jgi:hypothetical protein